MHNRESVPENETYKLLWAFEIWIDYLILAWLPEIVKNKKKRTSWIVNFAVQSGPGSNDDEGVLCISQISKAGVFPSDCLMSYLGKSVGGSYAYAKMQPVYSSVPVDRAVNFMTSLHLNIM